MTRALRRISLTFIPTTVIWLFSITRARQCGFLDPFPASNNCCRLFRQTTGSSSRLLAIYHTFIPYVHTELRSVACQPEPFCNIVRHADPQQYHGFSYRYPIFIIAQLYRSLVKVPAAVSFCPTRTVNSLSTRVSCLCNTAPSGPSSHVVIIQHGRICSSSCVQSNSTKKQLDFSPKLHRKHVRRHLSDKSISTSFSGHQRPGVRHLLRHHGISTRPGPVPARGHLDNNDSLAFRVCPFCTAGDLHHCRLS